MEYTTETKTKFHIGLKTADEKLDIHPSEIIEHIKDLVDAGTFYESKGLWKGETENSIIFEVVNFDKMSGDVTRETLKSELENKFNQESVLVTEEDVRVLVDE